MKDAPTVGLSRSWIVAVLSATGVATIPCATLLSLMAMLRAAAFSAGVNPSHALIASMASRGPGADIYKQPHTEVALTSEKLVQVARVINVHTLALVRLRTYLRCRKSSRKGTGAEVCAANLLTVAIKV